MYFKTAYVNITYSISKINPLSVHFPKPIAKLFKKLWHVSKRQKNAIKWRYILQYNLNIFFPKSPRKFWRSEIQLMFARIWSRDFNFHQTLFAATYIRERPLIESDLHFLLFIILLENSSTKCTISCIILTKTFFQ